MMPGSPVGSGMGGCELESQGAGDVVTVLGRVHNFYVVQGVVAILFRCYKSRATEFDAPPMASMT